MYICPVCDKEFQQESAIQHHFLSCWKDKNLNYKSKPAPRSEDIVVREINTEITNFFSSFQKE